MSNVKMILLTAGMLLFVNATYANRRVIRAPEVNTLLWSDLKAGKLTEVVIEFRQGDELPVTFEAQGDLIETRQNTMGFLGIKKNFWLRFSKNSVEISMDGISFKKFNEVLTGQIEVGAGSAQNGGVADAINILFKASIK